MELSNAKFSHTASYHSASKRCYWQAVLQEMFKFLIAASPMLYWSLSTRYVSNVLLMVEKIF